MQIQKRAEENSSSAQPDKVVRFKPNFDDPEVPMNMTIEEEVSPISTILKFKQDPRKSVE